MLSVGTSSLVTNTYFFLLGLSLGLILQVLVIAVQNATDYADLGAATSGATFFRSIGGSFGVAVFCSIFSARLATGLAAALAGAHLPPGFHASTVQANPALLDRLPAGLHDAIKHAYAGHAAADQVFEARRQSLEHMPAGWSPEQHADLTRLSRELLGEDADRHLIQS